MPHDSPHTETPLRWVRTAVFNIRQEEMAEIGGVSRPAISRYETGRDNPGYPFLVRVRAEAHRRGLAFSGDWFFSPPPPALGHAPLAHQVADGAPVQSADGDDAVPAAAAGDAAQGPAGGDGGEGVAGGRAAGFGQLGGVEVGHPDLNPVLTSARADADAQAVAVDDVNDRAGEGPADADGVGRRAPVGDEVARVGNGQGEDQGEGHSPSSARIGGQA